MTSKCQQKACGYREQLTSADLSIGVFSSTVSDSRVDVLNPQQCTALPQPPMLQPAPDALYPAIHYQQLASARQHIGQCHTRVLACTRLHASWAAAATSDVKSGCQVRRQTA